MAARQPNLHAIADKYVSRFAGVFESSARGLAPRVTEAMVDEDMKRGIRAHPESLYALIDTLTIAKEVASDPDVEKLIQQIVTAVGAANGVVMDLDSPFVLDAAKKFTAEMVTNVNKETKAAIRQMIFEAIRDGDSPAEAQKVIREVIGLTKRDAMTVKRAMALRPDKASALRDKLIRRRAITIARTETMRASNVGQKATWQQMVADGVLDPESRQIWIVTDDDRLCELCAPMEGQTVAMDEDFSSTERGVLPSARIPYDGETVETPPLHVSCRCTISLAIDE